MNIFNSDVAADESAYVAELLVGCANNGRADWVSRQLGNELGRGELILFQDGLLLRQITKEAIHCFVDGQFIATVLLAFSLIERSIAGRLLAVGETKVRDERSLTVLLKQACDKKWISQQESQDISKICAEHRNSLAHIRTPKESTRHEVRARNTEHRLCEILEEDARFVLHVAFNPDCPLEIFVLIIHARTDAVRDRLRLEPKALQTIAAAVA